MKKMVSLLMLVILVSMFMGCAAHVHKVGEGAQSREYVEARQWYVLWGLVPINEVDSQSMAEGNTNYEIKTESSALDIIINFFTSMVSVTSRTVTVTR